MCLLAFQWKEHPDYPLILVANREESFKRPASRLHYWKDEPDILAGRDLKGMGTWLGMTVAGKISAVTNEPFTPFEPIEPVISRGNLVREYLSGEEKPVPYGLKLKETRQHFNGYQLLFGDLSSYLCTRIQRDILKSWPPDPTLSAMLLHKTCYRKTGGQMNY